MAIIAPSEIRKSIIAACARVPIPATVYETTTSSGVSTSTVWASAAACGATVVIVPPSWRRAVAAGKGARPGAAGPGQNLNTNARYGIPGNNMCDGLLMKARSKAIFSPEKRTPYETSEKSPPGKM